MALLPRMALSDVVPGWLAVLLARLSPLQRRAPSRPATGGLNTLNAAALKDIGLTRGDLPSIENGKFFSDFTRKQR